MAQHGSPILGVLVVLVMIVVFICEQCDICPTIKFIFVVVVIMSKAQLQAVLFLVVDVGVSTKVLCIGHIVGVSGGMMLSRG